MAYLTGTSSILKRVGSIGSWLQTEAPSLEVDFLEILSSLGSFKVSVMVSSTSVENDVSRARRVRTRARDAFRALFSAINDALRSLSLIVRHWTCCSSCLMY